MIPHICQAHILHQFLILTVGVSIPTLYELNDEDKENTFTLTEWKRGNEKRRIKEDMVLAEQYRVLMTDHTAVAGTIPCDLKSTDKVCNKLKEKEDRTKKMSEPI